MNNIKKNWKRWTALFMAVAMVMTSGVISTNQSFRAADETVEGSGSANTADTQTETIAESTDTSAQPAENTVTQDNSNSGDQSQSEPAQETTQTEQIPDESSSESTTDSPADSTTGTVTETTPVEYAVSFETVPADTADVYSNSTLVSSPLTVTAGGSVVFTVSAHTGYSISTVTVNDTELTADAGTDDQYTLSNVNAAADVKVSTVANQYQLTVHYTDADGNKVAEDAVSEVAYGSAYEVTSPAVEGYTVTADQSTVSGTMTAEDTSVDVIYTKNQENSNAPVYAAATSVTNADDNSYADVKISVSSSTAGVTPIIADATGDIGELVDFSDDSTTATYRYTENGTYTVEVSISNSSDNSADQESVTKSVTFTVEGVEGTDTAEDTLSMSLLGATATADIPVTIHFKDDSTKKDYSSTIKSGAVTAPDIEGYEFVNATIGAGGVDIVGFTASYNNNIYYSTSEISDYAMLLGGGQSIVLNYRKAVTRHTVTYEVNGEAVTSDYSDAATGNAVSIDSTSVEDGETVSISVTAAMGYTATITGMSSSEQTLTPASNTASKIQPYTSAAITADTTISVTFTKTQETYTWSVENTGLNNWHGATFTAGSGITTKNGSTTSGTFTNGSTIQFTIQSSESTDTYGYYELNGLSLNNEALTIPTHHSATDVNADPSSYIGQKAVTKLSDGSSVTVELTGVTSYQKQTGWWPTTYETRYRFTFTITVENAREDMQLTDGNFHAVEWPEVMPNVAVGVKDGTYLYAYGDSTPNSTVSTNIPIPTYSSKMSFSFKLADGYENPVVTLEGESIECTESSDGTYTFHIDGYSSAPYYKHLEIKASAINYSIDYNLNGGSANPAPSTSGTYDVISNTSFKLSGITPTKQGYVFAGWTIGGTTYQPNDVVNVADVVSSAADGKITFTASWTKVDSSQYGTVWVKYYLERADGKYAEDGKYADYISAYNGQTVAKLTSAKEITGYTWNKGLSSLSAVAIEGEKATDESTIKMYYSLNRYHVYYSWTGDVPASYSEPIDQNDYFTSATYEVAANYPKDYTVTTEDGVYTFSGWTDPCNKNIVNSDVTITGVWTYTPKMTVTVQGYTGVYDGDPHSISLTGYPKGAVITYTNAEGNSRTDAGTTTVEYTVSKDGYVSISGKADIVINKRDVTLTSETASKEYDGTALSKNTVAVGGSGFVSGEATVSATGTITKVGSVTNTIVVTPGTNYKESNYNITMTVGTLTINQNTATITVTANSKSKTYDGTALTDGGFTVSGLPAGFTSEATVSGTITDYKEGGVENTITSFVIKHGDEDVTDQFSDITKTNGTLTINKRDVTLTAESENFTYDGKYHSNGNCITSGLVGADSIACTVTGSIKYVSDTPVENKITGYSFTQGNKDNYIVKTADGKLTMSYGEPMAISITADSNSWTYDGQEHSS
ncbi:MAG: MucBP domain-containing protein, partial [Solobacterium sp.]|nr:MucBP domain-containing protein [Solobacterium sp.]